MNLTLFLIGLWFSLFIIIIFLFANFMSKKDCKKYGGTVIFISFIISTAMTFLTGGFLG